VLLAATCGNRRTAATVTIDHEVRFGCMQSLMQSVMQRRPTMYDSYYRLEVMNISWKYMNELWICAIISPWCSRRWNRRCRIVQAVQIVNSINLSSFPTIVLIEWAKISEHCGLGKQEYRYNLKFSEFGFYHSLQPLDSTSIGAVPLPALLSHNSILHSFQHFSNVSKIFPTKNPKVLH
jgi:hypothetical protein